MIESKSKKVISVEEEILRTYSADRLNDIFRRFFRSYLAEAPSLFSDWNLNPKEFEGLSIRKREIVRLMAIVFSDETLFNKWFNQLPYMVSKVLETVIWEGTQEIGHLDQRTKGNILKNENLNDLDADLTNTEYCLFFITKLVKEKQKGSYLFYFDLPLTVRKRLKTYFPKPKGYELNALKSPKETEFTFTDQQKILSLLPLVLDYIAQGNLQQTKSGKPRKVSLNQLLKYTEIEEFFPQLKI